MVSTVSFLLSGQKPGPRERENLIGCDSVVKQTSSNIASELEKRRPGVCVSMWSCVHVVDVSKVFFFFFLSVYAHGGSSVFFLSFYVSSILIFNCNTTRFTNKWLYLVQPKIQIISVITQPHVIATQQTLEFQKVHKGIVKLIHMNYR